VSKEDSSMKLIENKAAKIDLGEHNMFLSAKGHAILFTKLRIH